MVSVLNVLPFILLKVLSLLDTEISSPSRTEISSMTPGDLFNFLTEEINIPSDDVKELESKCNIQRLI